MIVGQLDGCHVVSFVTLLDDEVSIKVDIFRIDIERIILINGFLLLLR